MSKIPKSKIPNLQVAVQEPLRRIIVTMPLTAYDATFGLVARGLCLLSGFGPDDRKASIASREFVVMAKMAATDKARELGWPTEGEQRATAWANRKSVRRW